MAIVLHKMNGSRLFWQQIPQVVDVFFLSHNVASPKIKSFPYLEVLQLAEVIRGNLFFSIDQQVLPFSVIKFGHLSCSEVLHPLDYIP